ncbi:MAG: helix-turn-helix domain-containing protein [Pseudobdellovibrionaceae bacterium]
MPSYKKMGLFLQEKRIEAGLTQIQLGEALGDVSGQFVSNWERGMCPPPSTSFQKLIEILDISRDKLVKIMLADSRTEIESKVFDKKKSS